MAPESDFELLAASLRADDRDIAAFVEALAVKLEGALPRGTRVVRRSVRLFSKQQRVERIEVDLGEERFALAQEGGAVVGRRSRAVRGIVLKSEELSLERWIESLAQTIAAEAKSSDEGRRALERLVAGDGASP